MGKKAYWWLAVTPDEYELPIAVANTARELGEMIGMSKHNVELNALRGYNGRIIGMKFVKVRKEDD